MSVGIRLKDIHFVLHKVGGTDIYFEISDEKEKGGDATILYYGYLAANGAWLIMENDTDEGTYRYIVGANNYGGNWTARETHSYTLYSTITRGE